MSVPKFPTKEPMVQDSGVFMGARFCLLACLASVGPSEEGLCMLDSRVCCFRRKVFCG